MLGIIHICRSLAMFCNCMRILLLEVMVVMVLFSRVPNVGLIHPAIVKGRDVRCRRKQWQLVTPPLLLYRVPTRPGKTHAARKLTSLQSGLLGRLGRRA